MNTDIQQINDLPFGRAYKITKGEQVQFVPSVTTVLKMNPDPFIDQLLLEMGPDRFKEIQNRGADRGTVMHKWLEVFLDEFGKDRDRSRSLLRTQEYIRDTDEFSKLPSNLTRAMKVGRELFYNFYNSGFHDKIGKVLHNEIFLHTFFRGGWAGACDFVYEDHDGKLVILDFKSSSIPKDPDKIDNYKMQISCYMFKYAEMFGRMPDRGEIVISNEATPDLQWVTVPGSEMKTHLRKFLGLMEKFRQQPEWIEFNNSHNQIYTAG
jgi:ATP-dependent exoDNAse (exonuclease V) beta subunit